MGKFRQVLKELSACKVSIFSFGDDDLSKIDGSSSNLVCALMLWRSGLGLL